MHKAGQNSPNRETQGVSHKTKHPTFETHFGLRALLIICIVGVLQGGIACSSDEIKIRSWEEAIDYAQSELAAAGDLEGRLEDYDQKAAKLSETIELIDRASPALDLIETLQEVQVPLVGNGWQILLSLLGMATADGAKIIDQLVDTLRSLADLKYSLDHLNGLPAVSEGVRVFRSAPERGTLSSLTSTSILATTSMERLRIELEKTLSPLEDATRNLGGLVRGLQKAAGAGIPVVSDAAEFAARRIGPIEGPMLALYDGLAELERNIEADIQVLENIQEAVRQARQNAE
jgi:hypothetical protein